jgi:hypothetical protein
MRNIENNNGILGALLTIIQKLPVQHKFSASENASQAKLSHSEISLNLISFHNKDSTLKNNNLNEAFGTKGENPFKKVEGRGKVV